jgi:sortase B
MLFYCPPVAYNEGEMLKINSQVFRNNRRLINILISIILAISISLIAFSALNTLSWFRDRDSANEIASDLEEAVVVEESEDNEDTIITNPPEDPSNDYKDFIKQPLISVSFDELLSRNPDTVGWISVKSTNINYPVVQSQDNDYYLKHAFDKSYNKAGWIFADYRNDMSNLGDNTIIYGHSRLDSTMFGSLKGSLNKSWYENKNNHIIFLSTPSKNTSWQVFSVYKIVSESYYLTTSFLNEEAHASFLDTLVSRSVHDFGVKLTTDDKIITLSTCANNKEDERIVLHARLIKEQNR